MDNLSKIKNLLNKDPRGLNIREISEKLKINRKLKSEFKDDQKYITRPNRRTTGNGLKYYPGLSKNSIIFQLREIFIHSWQGPSNT
jgi:hypothetical protein